MSDQATTDTSAPDDEVWARSKATGRMKAMRRDRRDILVSLGQWEECAPPGEDVSPAEVVRSFPTVPEDHGAAEQTDEQAAAAAADTTTSSGDGAEKKRAPRGGAEQKES